jgi:uncharacterized protein DUF6916
MSDHLQSLNARVFREQMHSKFNVNAGNGSVVPLELIEVTESDPSPKIELFTLQFQGPLRPRLNQQIHRLEHETLGACEIFLTAIAEQDNSTIYESVFHRFRKP